ncbi:MAG TPA: SRPBCC family protein [Jatrophihabitans sp.]|nr:SRPBCC family protein [Jatrophihabitans sp.]
MAPFVITRDTALTPQQAWARVVDWRRHGAYVPLTTVSVGRAAGATVVTARTGIGALGFDDPMEIVEWAPPSDGATGRCRLEKRGRVLRGWAEISVAPRDGGARVTWREEAMPAHLPRFAIGMAGATGALVFGRVLRRLLDEPG